MEAIKKKRKPLNSVYLSLLQINTSIRPHHSPEMRKKVIASIR